MTSIIITPQNAANHKWIWDFLETQRQSGKYNWQTKQNFSYNGTTFQFQQPVFARKRKDLSRGYAYEMTSEKLGAGFFGAVYRIACTLSNGKTGAFQVHDKKRVVKIQDNNNALIEYHRAKYADHLHVKQPMNGRMVMKEMEGMTLYDFLTTHNLSHKSKVELTKALIRAYKKQIADKLLIHNDLHANNILIKFHPNRPAEPFEINIIDFGLAYPHQPASTKTLYWDLRYILRVLWREESGKPELITNFMRGNFTEEDDYFQLFDEVIAAPTELTQKTVDKIVAYFKNLAPAEKILANQLKNIMAKAIHQSSAKDMEPIQKALLACKILLDNKKLDPDHHFTFAFDANPQKQHTFNKIFAYFQTLENKGKALMSTAQKDKGEKLCALVASLREKTFNVASQLPHARGLALLECGNQCKQLLNENKELLDIHRDNKYIWAEISIVLCSLIALYPIVAGINYLVTGRLGFFSQTNAAAGAEKLDADFAVFNPVPVY